MERPGGLILCGGRSSRMGQDKAGLRLPSGSTLNRALQNMGSVSGPLVVSLAAGVEPPPLPPGVRVVRDSSPEQGPLWGLLEGFRALAGQAETVLVMPVDMPFYTAPWMERLLAGLAGHRACLFRWEGYANALAAAYRLDLLDKLERLVVEGRARPMFLSEGEPTRIIDLEDHWGEGQGPPPLMDMDTPEDYRRVLLFEGVGNPAGVPVTVEVPRLDGGSVAVPLVAVTVGEALEAVGQLYPEWRLGEVSRRLVLGKTAPGGTWETRVEPLEAGLVLQIRDLKGELP